MRVLAVGNAYPPHHLGGYEVIWSGVMRHLRREGHQTRVLTTDYQRQGVPDSGTEEPDVHRVLEWYWREHAWRRLTPAQRLTLELRNARRFEHHLHDFGPDVVTWWPVGGMSLSLIERVRRHGLPAVLFVFDPWPSYGPQRDGWTRMWSSRPRAAALAQRLTGIPTRLRLANAGRWVFCSESMRIETAAAGIRTAGSSILHAGIEPAFLNAPSEPEAPAWRWRLLYVGRVVEQKGVRTAIECLPLLPAQASLEIVGEGDPRYRRELESLAARLGVSERVSFASPRARQELIATYREADVVVFPVVWAEPWGLVPLEAMALGRPVVATGRGGSADYLRDGENAKLFEAGDAAGLAAAIAALASDPELRRRLRAGGVETAARYSEDRFNRGAVAEIELALTSSSTPPGRP